jgi:dimethylamine corrinoid protein
MEKMMKKNQPNLLEKLAASVVEMDEVRTEELTQKALDMEIEAYDILQNGLTQGMNIVGEKYERDEYFIPQLLLCSDAMYAGLNVLKPALKRDNNKSAIKVVIGVVEGDAHDIGKSLVQMMLDAGGATVYDLGKNVVIDRFIETAQRHNATFICMSTLMSTTMDGMAKLIEKLKEKGIREKFKVIIGGGPVTQDYCRKIGADGYAPDAVKAVRLIQSLA